MIASVFLTGKKRTCSKKLERFSRFYPGSIAAVSFLKARCDDFALTR